MKCFAGMFFVIPVYSSGGKGQALEYDENQGRGAQVTCLGGDHQFATFRVRQGSGCQLFEDAGPGVAHSEGGPDPLNEAGTKASDYDCRVGLTDIVWFDLGRAGRASVGAPCRRRSGSGLES